MVNFSATVILFLVVDMTSIIISFFISVSTTTNIIITNVSITFWQFRETPTDFKRLSLWGEFIYFNKDIMLLLLLLLLLSHFSRVTLCDPIDGSPPGSPVPGILQARILEWVSISFSNAWKWKVKVKSLSHVWLFATAWTVAHQPPPSMGFSRQEY